MIQFVVALCRRGEEGREILRERGGGREISRERGGGERDILTKHKSLIASSRFV